MTFTDDDLERLKEHGDKFGFAVHMAEDGTFDLMALLARQEAAERVVKAVMSVRDLNFADDWRRGNKEIVDAYYEWRKASGK